MDKEVDYTFKGTGLGVSSLSEGIITAWKSKKIFGHKRFWSGVTHEWYRNKLCN